MPSRCFLLLLAVSLAGIPLWTSAQSLSPAEDAAVTYLERNWNRHGLTQADVQDLIITDAVTSRRSGATSVYLHQGIDEIPVIDGQMTISVDANGHVFHAAGQLIPDLPSRAVHSGSGVGPAAAANAIASEAGFPAPEPFQVVAPGVGPTQKTTLTDGGGHTYLPVAAELVYIVDDSGALRLAWDATVTLHGDDGAWRGLVDASSGEVLRLMDVLARDHFKTPAEHVEGPSLIVKNERSAAGMFSRPSEQSSSHTGECYRVFAWPLMDPFHADPAWPDDSRTWECDPADPTASPDGWHDLDGDNVPDSTTTRGNNAHAYVDWSGSNAPNPEGPDGGAELHFDFPIDFSQEPETYVDASATNLFYWNNIIHDVMVHYGFDEAHGNFQQHNYTSDGAGGDYVNAEAQDDNEVECNNANFATPADGEPGRMQMYLGCNNTPKMDGSLDNHVIVHEYGHGISNRMTGGPTNVGCLTNSEQMGEGWSDWYGLMLTQDQSASDFGRNESLGVGVFLMHPAAPEGFRLAPYNTDFAVNDYTYGDTQSMFNQVHAIGFAWATILWEVTWDVIDAYGYDQGVYNAEGLAGNQIMMSLVTEGLNLQPCSPGFVDGRDAIIEAVDVVYSDQDEQWRNDLKQALWGGFARRGLGHFADQGSSGSNDDNIEDFTISSEYAPDAITDLVAAPDGDFVTLTWTTPDDDDSDVLNYYLRYASDPILDETDWDNATEVTLPEGFVPQAPGTTEEFVVTGLDFETEYHFAVRSDDVVNTSTLSNSAQVTTLAAPVATVPTDPIDMAVSAEGTGTHEYTISNAGPSTLSYSLGFDETTPALTNSREAIPRPEASDREEAPDNEKGVEDAPPTGSPQLVGEGGPDAFGYRWIDSDEPGGPTYEWVDITDGTQINLGDEDREVIDLPWDFPYYENTYNWVVIHSNGALSFQDAEVHYANEPIPSADEPNAMLAAHWDDLSPNMGGSVYYKALDDGRFVVSWVDVPHYDFPSGSGSFTFQVILEPGGAIVYQYQEIDPGNFENEATVGIENADGTDGLQMVHNATYLHDELAVRLALLWVESDLTTGQIAAGEDGVLTLSFDAAGLEPGEYTADMTIVTNEIGDGLMQEYVVPISLTVEGVGTEDDGVAFEGTHRLSAVTPNPIASLATTSLEVADAQDVRVELFDVRGRKVATTFEGVLAARTAQEISLDAGALAPGVYVLRISGETFADSRRVTVVR